MSCDLEEEESRKRRGHNAARTIGVTNPLTMSSADNLKAAKDAAQAGQDLYGLLGVDGTATAADVHRAWKQMGLRYHPDKAGAAFDPDAYDALGRARDVLTDVPARAAYDEALGAAHARRRDRDLMDASRRRMLDDLEAREAAHRRARADEVGRTAERQRANEAQREALRREAEDDHRRREDEAAHDRRRRADQRARETRAADDEHDAYLAYLARRIEEKQQAKAEKKGKKRPRPGEHTAPVAEAAPAAPTAPTAPAAQGSDEWPAGGPELWQRAMDMLRAAQRVSAVARRNSDGPLSAHVAPPRPDEPASGLLLWTLARDRLRAAERRGDTKT